MIRKFQCMFVAIVLMAGVFSSISKADDIGDLKAQLKMLQTRIEAMEQKQIEKDAQLSEQMAKDVELSEQIAQVASQKTVEVPESIKWAEKIKLSGDFRYRHESINDDTKSHDRDRNRIRARVKMEALLNNEWSAVFRVATGSSDSPTSTNHTLGDSGGDGFSSRDIWLDWAYGDYHPEQVDGLSIKFGKMGYPFYKVGKHQLMVDGDVSPEGAVAKYQWDVDAATVATVTSGGYWVSERADDADSSLFGIQGMLKHKLNSDSHILGGLSYYDFGNIQGQSFTGISSKGNSTTGGFYDSDYDILEAFGEYGFKVKSMPMAVYGTYMNNVDCINDEDTAWQIGYKLNKAKSPGSWELSYNYRDVEADAVIGGLNDSDFIGGGTNGKGHVIGGKYQISKNVQTGLTYFNNTKNANSTEDDFEMIQLDIVLKF